jgi:4'-phosphopantetheinyl transferase
LTREFFVDPKILPAPPAPLLGPAVIHVCWFATDLAPCIVSELEPLLSLTERARADRFRFARDRGRYIAARARLRIILGRYTNRAPGELQFDAGPFGKPVLRPKGGTERIQFNLSGSHGLGVVALQLDLELGIDVERVRPLDDAAAIAERMFAAKEYAAFRSLPAAEQPESFFRYWTRKEAIVKSIGQGLAHPLDGFELSPEGGTPERLEFDCDGVRTVRWLLPAPSLRQGFVAALATAGSPAAMRCWAWPGG